MGLFTGMFLKSSYYIALLNDKIHYLKVSDYNNIFLWHESDYNVNNKGDFQNFD